MGARFQLQKNKPQNQKIVLVEIDLPAAVGAWINFEAGIWHTHLAPGDVTATDDYGLDCYYTPPNTLEYQRIGSVKVDGLFLLAVNNMADLRTFEQSYYFDSSTTELFIHLDDWHYPQGKTIRIGVINGFCDLIDPDYSGYYSNIFYEPRVTSIPKLSRRKDRLFYGSLEFQGGKISFVNNDGYFDDWDERDIFYQEVRVYLGFQGFDFNDFEQVYNGVIDGYKIDYKIFQIELKDKRVTFDEKMLRDRFTQDEYSLLSDVDVDTVKPVAYGDVYDVLCICLDAEQGAPSTFEFMFMNTRHGSATAVTEVRANGVPITPVSTDLAAGTFICNAVDVLTDNQLDAVTCDYIGINISNGADIIADILENYVGIYFNQYNYYLPEWTMERTRARDIGLAVIDESTITEVIDRICNSIDGVFFQKDNGVFSIRVFYEERPVSKIIRYYEWIDDPKFEYPTDEFLTDVTIKYRPRHEELEYSTYWNELYYDEVYEKYKVAKTKTIETDIADKTEAIEKSESVMYKSKSIAPIIKRKTKIQNIDLEIMDFVAATHDRLSEQYIDETEKDWKVYEIIGIKKDLSKHEIALTMQEVSVYDYEESVFISGRLWKHRLWNHRLFSVTRY